MDSLGAITVSRSIFSLKRSRKTDQIQSFGSCIGINHTMLNVRGMRGFIVQNAQFSVHKTAKIKSSASSDDY